MPTIDYAGRFHARGACFDKGSRAALGFPIKASRSSTARNFANKEILELLPGWGHGRVLLTNDGKFLDSWILRRKHV